MKKILQSTLLSISLFAISNQLLAQGNPNASNDFEVTKIVSPVAYKNYKLNDSADFIIRIRNLGPNIIYAGDQFKINYSIYASSGTNNQSYDTTINVGQQLNNGDIVEYTLRKNVKLDTFNTNFVACANVVGSIYYPVNTNKFPNTCSPFLVSIAKQTLKINKLYFAEEMLYFELNSSNNLTAEIFDITGKSLKKVQLSSAKKQQVLFNAPSNGFYFMKVYSNSTSAVTLKFVVNQ